MANESTILRWQSLEYRSVQTPFCLIWNKLTGISLIVRRVERWYKDNSLFFPLNMTLKDYVMKRKNTLRKP